MKIRVQGPPWAFLLQYYIWGNVSPGFQVWRSYIGEKPPRPELFPLYPPNGKWGCAFCDVSNWGPPARKDNSCSRPPLGLFATVLYLGECLSGIPGLEVLYRGKATPVRTFSLVPAQW